MIAALLTARAMVATRNGTIHTKLVCGTNISAGSANAAFRTVFTAIVTAGAFGTVHSFINGTLLTDNHACFFTAVQAGRRTILALAAFLAPASDFEIAFRALGAMGSSFGGTLPAKNCAVNRGTFLIKGGAIVTKHTFLAPATDLKIASTAVGAMASFFGGTIFAKNHSVGDRALLINSNAISAHTALFAPLLHTEKASFTAGTVGTLLIGTLKTHIASDFLVGAAATDLRAGTIGTNATFNAKINTRITFVTLAAIWRSVYQVITVRTSVCRKYRQCGCRNQSDNHNQRQ